METWPTIDLPYFQLPPADPFPCPHCGQTVTPGEEEHGKRHHTLTDVTHIRSTKREYLVMRCEPQRTNGST